MMLASNSPYSYITYLLLLVVIVLFYLWRKLVKELQLLRERENKETVIRTPDEEPVPGTDITPPGSDQKKWDCSTNNRQIILSNVPAGYTPYLYPFDEEDLRRKPLADFESLISIAVDIHLHNDEDGSVDDVDLTEPITLWISYNAQDALALESSEYTVDNLTPVKCIPNPKSGALEWRKFAEDSVNYDYINCGELGGVYIMIDTWSDPPAGWGTR